LAIAEMAIPTERIEAVLRARARTFGREPIASMTACTASDIEAFAQSFRRAQ